MTEMNWNRTDLIDESKKSSSSNKTTKANIGTKQRDSHYEEWQENRVKVTKVTVNEKGAGTNWQKKGDVYYVINSDINGR